MKRKILLAFTAVVICLLCALGLAACGSDSEVMVDGVLYTLNSDKASYAMTRVINLTTNTDFVIPSKVNGKPVTAIEDKTRVLDCSHITSITVPDSVTEIDDGAFSCFTGIESITVPFVGSTGCRALGLFMRNTHFYSIFGNEVTYSELLTKLKKVTVTGGTEIGTEAFKGNATLEEVILPESVTSIGWKAFYDCANLKRIDIPQNVTEIKSYAFCGCWSLKSLVIPDSVTEISNYAFQGCSQLRNVTLGKGVTDIGADVFSGNTKLVEVCNLSALEIKKGESIDNGGIGKNLQHIYGEGGESRIEVSDDGYVFVSNPDNNNYFLIDYDGSDTELVLPDQYCGMDYELWNYAFTYCRGLTKITVPQNVTFARNVFYNNTLYNEELREVVILAERSKLDHAFAYFPSLTTVTLPATIKSFGYYAFYDCENLKDIYYGGTMAEWNAIRKNDHNWRVENTVTIHCADGNLDKDGNQIQ